MPGEQVARPVSVTQSLPPWEAATARLQRRAHVGVPALPRAGVIVGTRKTFEGPRHRTVALCAHSCLVERGFPGGGTVGTPEG